MILQLLKNRRKRILIDVDTQRDLLYGDSPACTRNHRRVLANIRRIIAWARRNKVPVISTCLVCPNDNGQSMLDYCLDGTNGQKKIHYTLLNNRANFAADNNMYLPRDILRRYRQLIFNKRSMDPFEEPRIERLLSEVKASEFIIIGSIAEDAVLPMALGLLHRGKKVSLVTDAVGSHDTKEAMMAIRKIHAKGAKLIETKKLAGSSNLKQVGACNCKTCRKSTKKVTANN